MVAIPGLGICEVHALPQRSRRIVITKADIGLRLSSGIVIYNKAEVSLWRALICGAR